MERREVKLGDIITYNKGYAFKSNEYTNTGKMVVRVTDFTLDSISDNDSVYLEPNDKYKKFIIITNDILIQTVGSWANNPNSIVGKVVRVPDKCNKAYLNQNIVRIIPNRDFNNTYLYYALKANQFSTYCVLRGQGAANQASITLDTIFKFKFRAHLLSEQKRIADILSSYDNLIENNNKRIKLLEQMAENLYKEWFVRFRFPGYEDVEFENGIPKGWEEVRLGEFINLASGYAFKSDWWTDQGVPVIKIKDIQNGKIDLTNLDYVSEDNAQKAKNFYVGKGDILIALTGATIGKVGIVTHDNVLVNQRVGKFFIKKPSIKNIGYIYSLFKQNWIQELIVMYSGSNAAQPNISPFDIEKFKIIYNKVYVDKFNVIVYPIYDSIIKLYEKNELLEKQRDLLLPRLMSGKLEV